MKNMKINIFLFIMPLFLSSALFAQSSPDFSFHIQLMPNQSSIINYDTIYDVSCIITLQDTMDISKIHVKMGTASGTSDKLNYAYLYDINTGLQGNLSYNRNGNIVTLGVGEFSAFIYFFEIKLENTSGTVSQAQMWNTLTR